MNKIILKRCLKDKSNYISILIIVLSILLITIACSFYKMCLSYYKDVTMTLDYRMLDSGTGNDKKVPASEYEKIMEVDHVVDYYPYAYTFGSIYVNKIGGKEYDSGVSLVGIGDKVNINLVEGSRNMSKYEIICPTIFALSYADEIAKDKSLIIDLKVGDEIEGYIVQRDIFGNIHGKENIKLKVVGKYSEVLADGNQGVCYANHELIKEIYDIWSYYEKEFTDFQSDILVVDNAKNIDEVMQKLTDMGYYVKRRITFDLSITLFWFFLSVAIVLVISAVTTFINIVIYNKNKEQYIMEGMLYKTFGYTDKDILKIYTKQLLFIEMIGAFITLIILTIVQLILSNMLKNNPFIFYGYRVSVSFIGYILALLVNFIIIMILRKKFNKYLNEASIIKELKNNE